MSFAKDDAWQRSVRDRRLVPYYEHETGGRYVLADGKGSSRLQRHYKVDTVIQTPDGMRGIDEKFVRWTGHVRGASSYLNVDVSVLAEGLCPACSGGDPTTTTKGRLP